LRVKGISFALILTVIPSFFVAKDGKKTDLQAGSMSEKNMQNYLNDNKNGPSSKK